MVGLRGGGVHRSARRNHPALPVDASCPTFKIGTHDVLGSISREFCESEHADTANAGGIPRILQAVSALRGSLVRGLVDGAVLFPPAIARFGVTVSKAIQRELL